MSVDLDSFLENSGNAIGVAVRCGEQRNPRMIGKVFIDGVDLPNNAFGNFDPVLVDSWEELHDEVVGMLEDQGWGIEPLEETARIHLIGPTGSQMRTWSRTRRVETSPQMDTAASLANELIRSCAEVRKMGSTIVRLQAETIQSLAVSNRTLRDETLDARTEAIQASAEVALTEAYAELDNNEQEQPDPLRTAAGEIITGLASQFMPAGALDIKQLLLTTMSENPALAQDLVNDPQVVQALMDATAEPGSNGMNTPAAEITPSPMDE